MIRIVVLSRKIISNPRSGGAGRYVHETFRRLTHLYRITVIGEGSQNSPEHEEVEGIEYVNVRGSFVRPLVALKYLTNFARNTDLVVDHADVAIPWLLPLFVNKPKITIVHQLVKEIYYYQLARPWADICAHAEKFIYGLYSGSRIVVSSPSTARELVELGIPSSQISTVIPGHDPLSGEGMPLCKRDMTIACVSRLVRYKGIQFALRAFRDVLPEHPEATFKIAGTGPYESSLREITNSLGIKQHVEFLGRISEKAKFELLSRSRAAVFPSVRDGFGITVMEANSVGTPVVGWKVPGPSDSVIDGTTGLLAAFPDEGAFARNLV